MPCSRSDFFGETSLLRRPESILAGVRPPVYKRTATAMTDCIIHTLSAESFADVCPSRAKSASCSLRRAPLMPQVKTGLLYRCGKRT